MHVKPQWTRSGLLDWPLEVYHTWTCSGSVEVQRVVLRCEHSAWKEGAQVAGHSIDRKLRCFHY